MLLQAIGGELVETGREGAVEWIRMGLVATRGVPRRGAVIGDFAVVEVEGRNADGGVDTLDLTIDTVVEGGDVGWLVEGVGLGALVGFGG